MAPEIGGAIFLPVFIVAALIFAYKFFPYFPLPPVSRRRGSEEIFGKVILIDKTLGSVVEVTITKDMARGIAAQKEYRLDPHDRTVSFRKKDTLPEVGDIVAVKTKILFYTLEGRYRYWVDSWHTTKASATGDEIMID
jgi:hypothetical protein